MKNSNAANSTWVEIAETCPKISLTYWRSTNEISQTIFFFIFQPSFFTSFHKKNASIQKPNLFNPLKSTSQATTWQDLKLRLSFLFSGPGLGRNQSMLGRISIIMDKIKTENIPVVIDADGLWHLTNNPLIIKGYRLGHSPIFLLNSFPKRFPRWKQPSLNWQICRHTPTNIYTQGLKTGFLSVAQDTKLLIQTVTDGMYR